MIMIIIIIIIIIIIFIRSSLFQILVYNINVLCHHKGLQHHIAMFCCYRSQNINIYIYIYICTIYDESNYLNSLINSFINALISQKSIY